MFVIDPLIICYKRVVPAKKPVGDLIWMFEKKEFIFAPVLTTSLIKKG